MQFNPALCECGTGFQHCRNLPGFISPHSRERRLGKAALLHPPEPAGEDRGLSRHLRLAGLDLLHHGLHSPVSEPHLFGRLYQHVHGDMFHMHQSHLGMGSLRRHLQGAGERNVAAGHGFPQRMQTSRILSFHTHVTTSGIPGK